MSLRRELPPMLALATPVVLGEIGWMAMGIVDTIMVGRLGAEAIGAVSIGSILFDAAGIFAVGLLLGLDTLVSQSYGAGDLEDCHHSLRQGVILALLLTPPLIGVLYLFAPLMRVWGVQPVVLDGAIPYLQSMAWSGPPLLVYAAFRRYLQSMNLAQPVMFALLSANVVNAIFNWLLIYGHDWGWVRIPAYGVTGAGWATFWARMYMAAVLVGYAGWLDWRRQTGLFRRWPRWDGGRIRELVRLGLPAASQILLEIGVFGVATVLAGRLRPVDLAAHHIALNNAGLTFMVPLGISSAGAVRVGQALGRRDPRGARRAGWMALALGAGFMVCAGAAFLLAPRTILAIYTNDPAVIELGVGLLAVAAVFQLFDGIQVVSTGILRGAGDTKSPMLANLAGHWLLGLPVGTALCFSFGWGVVGLWTGLSLGLISVGGVLLAVWWKRSRAWAQAKRAAWEEVGGPQGKV